MSDCDFKPTHNWVYFEETYLQETASGLVLTETVPSWAKVVAVGPGIHQAASGAWRPTCCKPGDVILLNIVSGMIHEFHWKGRKFHMVKDTEIAGVLDPELAARYFGPEPPRVVTAGAGGVLLA